MGPKKRLQHVKRISQKNKKLSVELTEYHCSIKPPVVVEPVISNLDISIIILDWFKEQIEWKALVNRNFSLLIYALLKEAGIGYIQINKILKIIGGVKANNLVGYFRNFQTDDFSSLNEDGRTYTGDVFWDFQTDDFSSLNEDGRTYTGDVFWDRYPDIEIDAKLFELEKARAKNSDFIGKSLNKNYNDRCHYF
jgi:hypothetical protein